MLPAMDRNLLNSLTDYFAQQADRPFGNVEMVSGRSLQPFSIAGEEAAKNLLRKASRALDSGDLDRMRALVDRAVRLPFDEHEQSHPAAITAHMELYGLVTDALEGSDEDDSRWLQAAVDALETADEPGRCEMRDVLMAIDQDYGLQPGERVVIRAAVAQVPQRTELRDLRLSEPELRDCILSLLRLCREYRAALEASAPSRA